MKQRNTSRLGAALVVSVLAVALLSAAPARGHDDSGYCCELCVERYAGTYADLHGWGHWTWVPDVGAHVWFPYVETSWRPFTHGRWIRTRHGITWTSDEPWGAIPHHYGHWIFVDRAGWGWIPGREYSPAPVTWVVVDGYVGWAPVPPPGYRYPPGVRVGFRMGGPGWSVSYGRYASDLDVSFWVFVADDDFYGRPVHRHVLPARSWPSLVKGKEIRSAGSRLDADLFRKLEKKRAIRSGVPVREERSKARSVEPRERGEKSRPSVVAKTRDPKTAQRQLASGTPAKKKRSTSGTAVRNGDATPKRRAR